MAISYPSDSVTETLITQIQNLGGTPTSYGLGELMRLLADLQGQGGGAGAGVIRTVSATVGLDEVTIFQGSSASQTLTLPTPVSSATNVIKNYASVPVVVGPGVLNGFFGFISLLPGDSVSLSFVSGTWYPTGTQQHPALPVLDIRDFGSVGPAVDSSIPINAAITELGALPGIILCEDVPLINIDNTIVLGNANLFETTVRAGSNDGGGDSQLFLNSSTTVNNESQGASIAASGFVFVYSASLVASKVTYTHFTGSGATTVLHGCVPTMATLAPITGAAVGQGAPSTANNITFMGSGLPGAFATGTTQAAPQIKWGGAAGGEMLKMYGPVSGMWVKNLQFNCVGAGGSAAVGIEEIATQGCRFDNVQIAQATSKCWFASGNSGAWGGSFNGLINGGTVGNIYDNIGIVVGTTAFAAGFWFNGVNTGEASGAWGSGGPTHSNWDNIFMILLDPGTGNTNIGWYAGFCDSIVVDNVRLFPTASLGTNEWLEQDFTQGGSDPSNITFDHVTHYAVKPMTFFTNPPTTSAQEPFGVNTIRNVESGFKSVNSPTSGSGGPGPNLANPKQFNLQWNVAGGETFVLARATADTYFTTGSPKQISATDPVYLVIEETTSVTWTAAIQNTVLGATENQTIKSSANPGANTLSTIPVPQGWFVTITCATMADLTVTALTRTG